MTTACCLCILGDRMREVAITTVSTWVFDKEDARPFVCILFVEIDVWRGSQNIISAWTTVLNVGLRMFFNDFWGYRIQHVFEKAILKVSLNFFVFAFASCSFIRSSHPIVYWRFVRIRVPFIMTIARIGLHQIAIVRALTPVAEYTCPYEKVTTYLRWARRNRFRDWSFVTETTGTASIAGIL